MAAIPGHGDRVEKEAVPLRYCYERPKVHYPTAILLIPTAIIPQTSHYEPVLFTFVVLTVLA